MNKWVKRKWLKALRSGEYGKGRSTLSLNHEEYCCLGVLGEEMVPELCERDVYEDLTVDGNDTFLPDDLAILWGLSEDDQEKLAEINDTSDTFAPVIDYIENNL